MKGKKEERNKVSPWDYFTWNKA